ncbi:MAG: glycogen synthase GlgA [Acidobacteria bacterium]|nr:glycogen synthase GlgA [Acidobacteriota bacterium]MBI3655055.1 glycogen synthase GlgA [Acidobacteriota bacterium]
MSDTLKILLVAAEAVPFAKVGGLGDVVGALPPALQELGAEARLCLPSYQLIDNEKFNIQRSQTVPVFTVPMGPRTAEVTLYQGASPQNDQVKVYLIGNNYYFGRDGIYDDPRSRSGYWDNGERYAFFMKAVLPALKALNWKPDIIHCHDHQTALVPAFLRSHYWNDPFFQNTATIFTIHNLAYQGIYDSEILSVLGFDPGVFYPTSPYEFYGKVNFMKLGIYFADLITTVSARYAQEIQTTYEFGMGLEGILRARSQDLYGILNGVDYSVWNPETDRLIARHYSAQDLAGKRDNKLALLKEARLSLAEEQPLIGIVSRLVNQKGFDLIAEKIEAILALGVKLVVLGSGQSNYHDLFSRMAQIFPKQMSVFFTHDDRLAHMIEAGSDMFLMPSRYEPCGLNQMYSLRYGTIPIVRSTGGLADTVTEYNPNSDNGNGFCFYDYNAHDLYEAVRRAVQLFHADKAAWTRLMRRAMAEDYSWVLSAKKYIEVYEKARSRRR